jgi:antitoxin VapB
MLTRIYKSGNSLAVRIPKELVFDGGAQVVDIERVGNTLVLRPVVTETIGDLSDIFAAFPKGFMAEGRESSQQSENE